MFNDLKSGQTHYENDGCGIPEHNYNHISHVHCWNQNGNPPCGIPMEKHTQCCLCDLTPHFPKSSALESALDENNITEPGIASDLHNATQKCIFAQTDEEIAQARS